MALGALEFLWTNCRAADGGMYHCFDSAAQVHGLLSDETQMGSALLLAHAITGDVLYLERAKELATFILTRLKNPAGGYYDICTPGAAYLKLRLTLIEQNGPAASFFLALAEATGDTKISRSRAVGLCAFHGEFRRVRNSRGAPSVKRLEKPCSLLPNRIHNQ